VQLAVANRTPLEAVEDVEMFPFYVSGRLKRLNLGLVRPLGIDSVCGCTSFTQVHDVVSALDDIANAWAVLDEFLNPDTVTVLFRVWQGSEAQGVCYAVFSGNTTKSRDMSYTGAVESISCTGLCTSAVRVDAAKFAERLSLRMSGLAAEKRSKEAKDLVLSVAGGALQVNCM
jgi:hypothetical protein